jgi:atrial natriuretic peptide-converting enzyme
MIDLVINYLPQLYHRVTFHEHLLPVCLPEEDFHLKEAKVCTVIGWGKRKDEDGNRRVCLKREIGSLNALFAVDYEPVINEVEVPVVEKDKCNKWLEENKVNVTDTMICAGLREGGKDACQVNILILLMSTTLSCIINAIC